MDVERENPLEGLQPASILTLPGSSKNPHINLLSEARAKSHSETQPPTLRKFNVTGKRKTERLSSLRWGKDEILKMLEGTQEFFKAHNLSDNDIAPFAPSILFRLKNSLIDELSQKLRGRSRRSILSKMHVICNNLTGTTILQDVREPLQRVLSSVRDSYRIISPMQENKIASKNKKQAKAAAAINVEILCDWTEGEEEQLIMGLCAVIDQPFGSSFPDTTDIPWDLVTRYVQNKSSLACERYFNEVLKVKYWNGKIPQPWTLYSDYIFFKMLSEEGPATIEDVQWIKIQQLLSQYFKVDVDFLKTRLHILSCRFPKEQSLQQQLLLWLKTCYPYEPDFPTNDVSWNHDSMNHGTPKQQNLHRQLRQMCYPEQSSSQAADGGGISKGLQANTDHPPDSSVYQEPVLYRENILPSLASCVEIQSTAVSRT